MMKLKINMWTGILDIVNCVLFAVSWFVIFGTAFSDATTGGNATGGASAFFYTMAWVGVVLNIVALVKSKKANLGDYWKCIVRSNGCTRISSISSVNYCYCVYNASASC